MDFSLVGILHSIIGPLKDVGISVFVVSTFDTDYIFVKTASRKEAIRVWSLETVTGSVESTESIEIEIEIIDNELFGI